MGLHPSIIYRLLRQGKLPVFKVGSDWCISREALDRWCLVRQRTSSIPLVVPGGNQSRPSWRK
jgi:excisionase family DNA binding protein